MEGVTDKVVFEAEFNLLFYDENKKFISQTSWNPSITNSNGLTILIPSNAKYVICEFTHNLPSDKDLVLSNLKVQIEKGDTATFYEPFKSNILSTPQDLELRGIGNVKDTLDLMTGDVTERVGEVVLDGSENWIKNDIYTGTSGSRFVLEIDDIKKVSYGKILCDKMQVNSNVSSWQTEGEYISADETNISRINIRKTQDMTVEEFKQWLSQNPITVQYQLATESVKTVDLSDYHVYSYKDTTHYDCSAAEGSLIPTLSIDVPTSLPALVSRQRATIKVQKEQIQTLESENEQLIAQNEVQDTDIALNQDAINFMLFAPATMSVNNEYRNNEGVNTMAAYLANQILKGKLDYALVVGRYGSYKQDIDTILIAEGKQDLIK